MAFDTVEARILLTAENRTRAAFAGVQQELAATTKQAEAINRTAGRTTTEMTRTHAAYQRVAQSAAAMARSVGASVSATTLAVTTSAANMARSVGASVAVAGAAVAKGAQNMARSLGLTQANFNAVKASAAASLAAIGNSIVRGQAAIGRMFTNLSNHAHNMKLNVAGAAGNVVGSVIGMGMRGAAALAALGVSFAGFAAGVGTVAAGVVAAVVTVSEAFKAMQYENTRTKAQLANFGFDGEKTFKLLKQQADELSETFDHTFTSDSIEAMGMAVVRLGIKAPEAIKNTTKAMMDFKLVSGLSTDQVIDLTAGLNSAQGAISVLNRYTTRLTQTQELQLEGMEKAGMYAQIAEFAMRRLTAQSQKYRQELIDQYGEMAKLSFALSDLAETGKKTFLTWIGGIPEVQEYLKSWRVDIENFEKALKGEGGVKYEDSWLGQMFVGMKNEFHDVMVVVNGVKSFVEYLNSIPATPEGLGKVAQDAWRLYGGSVRTALNDVNDALVNAQKATADYVNSWLAEVTRWYNEGKAKVVAIKDSIVGTLQDTYDTAKTAVGTFINDYVTYFGTLYDTAAAKVIEIKDRVLGIFSSMYTDALAGVSKFVDDYVQYFKDMYKDIVAQMDAILAYIGLGSEQTPAPMYDEKGKPYIPGKTQSPQTSQKRSGDPSFRRDPMDYDYSWQDMWDQAQRQGNMIPGGAVPHRASGGSVTKGQPYEVGEQGRELFVPDGSGKIVPNSGYPRSSSSLQQEPGDSASKQSARLITSISQTNSGFVEMIGNLEDLNVEFDKLAKAYKEAQAFGGSGGSSTLVGGGGGDTLGGGGGTGQQWAAQRYGGGGGGGGSGDVVADSTGAQAPRRPELMSTGSKSAGGWGGGAALIPPAAADKPQLISKGQSAGGWGAGAALQDVAQQASQAAEQSQQAAAQQGAPGQFRPQYKLTDRDLSDETLKYVIMESNHTNKSRQAVIDNLMNRVGSSKGRETFSDTLFQKGQYEATWRFRNAKMPSQKELEATRQQLRDTASGNTPSTIGSATSYRAVSYMRGAGAGKTASRQWQKQGGLVAGGNAYFSDQAPGPFAPYKTPKPPAMPMTAQGSGATTSPAEIAQKAQQAQPEYAARKAQAQVAQEQAQAYNEQQAQQKRAVEQRDKNTQVAAARDPFAQATGAARDPFAAAQQQPPTQQLELGRGQVDVNLKLDKGLSASKPTTTPATNFDTGVAVDNTGAGFSRPGDPSFHPGAS